MTRPERDYLGGPPSTSALRTQGRALAAPPASDWRRAVRLYCCRASAYAYPYGQAQEAGSPGPGRAGPAGPTAAPAPQLRSPRRVAERLPAQRPCWRRGGRLRGRPSLSARFFPPPARAPRVSTTPGRSCLSRARRTHTVPKRALRGGALRWEHPQRSPGSGSAPIRLARRTLTASAKQPPPFRASPRVPSCSGGGRLPEVTRMRGGAGGRGALWAL